MMYTLTQIRDTYRYSKLVCTRATLSYDTNEHVSTRDTLDTWMCVARYTLRAKCCNDEHEPSTLGSFQFFVPVPIIVRFFRFPSPRLYPFRSFVPRLFTTKKTTSNIVTSTARRLYEKNVYACIDLERFASFLQNGR